MDEVRRRSNRIMRACVRTYIVTLRSACPSTNLKRPKTDRREQGRVQVDVGLGEEILAKCGELQEAVLPRWRGAVDDVHAGLDAMMALGGASVLGCSGCVLCTVAG